jgi:hypothetical protein
MKRRNFLKVAAIAPMSGLVMGAEIKRTENDVQIEDMPRLWNLPPAMENGAYVDTDGCYYHRASLGSALLHHYASISTIHLIKPNDYWLWFIGMNWSVPSTALAGSLLCYPGDETEIVSNPFPSEKIQHAQRGYNVAISKGLFCPGSQVTDISSSKSPTWTNIQFSLLVPREIMKNTIFEI